jgi:uncharacterized membrane protein YecN with MAPEG domain
MHLPSVTAGYLAVLALVYAVLGLQVVRLRGRIQAGFGDGGSDELRCAIRAHAHFAEYVPIIALMAAMLEISGLPALRVHMLMGTLLLARLLHPFGMHAKPRTVPFRLFRTGGMTLTVLVMVVCAVLILTRLLRGG